MTAPYQVGELIPISLSPSQLPGYALNSIFRMLIALVCSLAFTFIVAPIAAKSQHAEKVLIPLLDVLESVPILGYLSITVVGFIQLFPNSLLGPQFAAIFAIFTSQVWNMALGFYQSLRTVPSELYDTAAVFQLNAWQRFWRIEVPHAMPSLIWNTMMSLSNGWFFVVAAEAISVANQNILLPGIGSYISVAIQHADLTAILYAILTMLIVILLYDQLLFRPLLTWMDRFKPELDETHTSESWFYEILVKTRLLKRTYTRLFAWSEVLLSPRLLPRHIFLEPPAFFSSTLLTLAWYSVLWLATGIGLIFLYQFITQAVSLNEVWQVFQLGAFTMLKVFILILLASLFWVPVGVWIGLHPKARQFFQPLTQFLAAFPINLIYPIAVTLILHYQLNVEIWTTPLMILGTQWYILFNIIAGASAIPKDLRLAVKNFSLSPWLKWKRLIFPAIFPYYVTGAMTAAGGCWNVSIVTEVLSWGDQKLVATGIGSYIAQYTTSGDFPRVALGIMVMCFYVLIINRLLWHRLYHQAATRFVIES